MCPSIEELREKTSDKLVVGHTVDGTEYKFLVDTDVTKAAIETLWSMCQDRQNALEAAVSTAIV